MSTPILQFVHRDQTVSLCNVPPARTLLQVLREDIGITACKEGCNEGDCGACTVVLGELQGDNIRYRAVNSCLRLAHSVHGLALWTAADVSAADGTPHPIQRALLEQHASQCGFCTPGFVMSLFAVYQNHVCKGESVSRAMAVQTLSGNLCRCTGYRPILDAAQVMGQAPLVRVDETRLRQKLERIQAQRPEVDTSYLAPSTLASLLATRAARPDAVLVAGGTDLVIAINKAHLQCNTVLDLTRVTELQQIETDDRGWRIGAAVRLEDAFAALLNQRPQLEEFAQRFASLPVRNSGTLGGNIANASPIGDSMPLLIALRSTVVLASKRGEREMPLESLYTAYRKTVLASDEVLAWIRVPHAVPNEQLFVYKVSKRFEDDISAVCLAIRLQLHEDAVQDITIGAGGIAGTPVRAHQTEAMLRGQVWNRASVVLAIDVLRSEFKPISDLRASAAYRCEVLGNLLQRCWLESQGETMTRLTCLPTSEATA